MTASLDGTLGVTFPDSTTQATGAFYGGLGFRNRIINGAMVISQINGSSSFTPTDGSITLDRWKVSLSQASKLTIQQNAGSVTPPVSFANYLGITSSSAYAVSASDNFNLFQRIEGYNVADLGWGTANAKTVTLSFQVYSSLTGTFGAVLKNDQGSSRSYPFTYTISSANTWTSISVTIAGDTSGTWTTTNGVGIALWFGLGVGSTLSGTAGAWSSTSYYSATGATSVVGTNNATFYITGVQLEKGSTATSFDYRPYGTEFALCQRYYVQYTATAAQYFVSIGQIAGTTAAYFVLPLTLRGTPAVAVTGAITLNDAGANPAITSISAISSTTNNVTFVVNALGGGLTIGRAAILLSAASGNAITVSSEL